MVIPNSGPISFLNLQTELGGSDPITMTEYKAQPDPNPTATISLGDYRGRFVTFNIVSANALPTEGTGGGSYPPASTRTASWVGLQNASADDAFLTINLPFTFFMAGTGYTQCFIGSNSYLTFGGGSTVYSALSASNPPVPKLMFGAADNSYQRVSTYTDVLNRFVRIRYEGSASTQGSVGFPNIVAEITLINPQNSFGFFSFSQLIELRVGLHARTTGVSLIGNASTSYATYTITPNQSYVFRSGDQTGTSWSVFTGQYVNWFYGN